MREFTGKKPMKPDNGNEKQVTARLLKNAHTLKGTTRPLCCAANRTAQRISIRVTFRLYASRFGFLRALHLNIFEQP
jgi:hypothetical protein